MPTITPAPHPAAPRNPPCALESDGSGHEAPSAQPLIEASLVLSSSSRRGSATLAFGQVTQCAQLVAAGQGMGASWWGETRVALSRDSAARMWVVIDVPMPSSDPELERLWQITSALPLGARIIRSVASSTAIETGQQVADIERALKDRQSTQAAPA